MIMIGTGNVTMTVTVIALERGRGNKDYGRRSHERGRGYTQERDIEYEYPQERDIEYELNEPIQDLERHGARERELEPGGHDYGREWYGERAKHGHGHDYDYREKYDNVQHRGFGEPEHERERLKRQVMNIWERLKRQVMNIMAVNIRIWRVSITTASLAKGDPDQHEEGEADGEYQRSERSQSR